VVDGELGTWYLMFAGQLDEGMGKLVPSVVAKRVALVPPFGQALFVH